MGEAFTVSHAADLAVCLPVGSRLSRVAMEEAVPSVGELLVRIEYWLHRLDYVFCGGIREPEPFTVKRGKEKAAHTVDDIKRLLSLPRK